MLEKYYFLANFAWCYLKTDLEDFTSQSVLHRHLETRTYVDNLVLKMLLKNQGFGPIYLPYVNHGLCIRKNQIHGSYFALC